MRRFIELSYRGTRFHGWQRQPNACSVQQALEEALSRVVGSITPLTGAGRTDTGVHARQMFAHFDSNEPLAVSDERLAAALNTMCGRDIAVYRVFPVNDDLHARFSATARTYRYYLHFGKDPFMEGLSWQASASLDIDVMNLAAKRLLEVNDFTSFAKLHSDAKTNICNVTEACWSELRTPADTPAMMFQITADRFLRNMVRAVVGTLVEVGRRKLSLSDFNDVIEARDRCAAATSMPAHALYLWKIQYPGFE